MSEQSLAIRQALGVERLGEIMYKSGYWQDTRSQSQAIVKILRGAELDIGPIASMDGVFIIEGRTTLNSTLMASLIQRSGRYRYRVVEHDDKHCVIDFFEIVDRKREKLGTSSFSLDDAKTAGLLGKGSKMWEKYPRNMVFSRALSNGAKWYTPDIFSGPIYTPDELGVEVDAEGNVIDVPPREPDVPKHDEATAVATGDHLDRLITSADDRIWKRWEQVRAEALEYGIVPPDVKPGLSYKQLVSTATSVKAKVTEKQVRLAREEAERRASKEKREAEREVHQAADDAWADNRLLMEQAYAAGVRLRDLPTTATREEVLQRNDEIRLALEQQDEE